jgi:hypothetical protein
MKEDSKKIDKFIKVYLLVGTFLLAAGFYYLNGKVDKLSDSLGKTILPDIATSDGSSDVCGETCKSQIESSVASAIASLSGTSKTPTPKPTSLALPSASSKTQTAYIPLAGPVTTTSTAWVDVPGTEVYIDLASDYGKNAQVSWDTFLSIANSNGQAFARLYDATHGIAVDGSTVSVVNNSALTQVASGNLNLWSGRNLYRVQIKSLNSFTVTFGSGRIKITY